MQVAKHDDAGMDHCSGVGTCSVYGWLGKESGSVNRSLKPWQECAESLSTEHSFVTSYGNRTSPRVIVSSERMRCCDPAALVVSTVAFVEGHIVPHQGLDGPEEVVCPRGAFELHHSTEAMTIQLA